MEKLVIYVIEIREGGKKIVRNFFFNEDNINWLVKV